MIDFDGASFSRNWFYFPIPMPLNEYGYGPVSDEECHKMTYEVWDRFCNTYASFDYLYDAIDLSLYLCQRMDNTWSKPEEGNDAHEATKQWKETNLVTNYEKRF